MGTFDKCFLFLRQHNAGVEDVDLMVAAGFQAIFCNIGDPASPPDAWATIRSRAASFGIPCGPWLRVQDPGGGFGLGRLQFLISVAKQWNQPYIVNAEKELDNSGATLTTKIAATVGDDDCAISMEGRLYDAVDWTPVAHIPMLLQIFPELGATDASPYIQIARDKGIECVYATFGSYGGRKPSDYKLQAPYSVYTADDCHQNYAAWSPTSTGYVGCVPVSEPEVTMAGVKTEVDKAWLAFESASVPDKWRTDNKGEYNKIKAYYKTPGSTAPIGIESDFGKGLLALVEAGKYADGTHA
jgi:hypothetical protein